MGKNKEEIDEYGDDDSEFDTSDLEKKVKKSLEEEFKKEKPFVKKKVINGLKRKVSECNGWKKR